MITPPRGAYDELTPFANVIISGSMPSLSMANQSPLLRKPAITSSATSKMPYFFVISLTPLRYPFGYTYTPLEPGTDSMKSAAIFSGPSCIIWYSSLLRKCFVASSSESNLISYP